MLSARSNTSHSIRRFPAVRRNGRKWQMSSKIGWECMVQRVKSRGHPLLQPHIPCRLGQMSSSTSGRLWQQENWLKVSLPKNKSHDLGVSVTQSWEEKIRVSAGCPSWRIMREAKKSLGEDVAIALTGQTTKCSIPRHCDMRETLGRSAKVYMRAPWLVLQVRCEQW